ncbi:hypothetical protein OS242_10570 [Tumebacillus sp. DT12]|uniref:Uncharacterized protein n=1 Tax=Tumebacillus lacus TaxID=2995335 RepID=A0ABT3X0H1_9BACL|nr:hypothetical protein [Tumebacillus lacus]MCX7570406.1 hypothetical protein [Tumebacillus lacus]
MARKKNEPTAELVNNGEAILLWKAKGPLSNAEHEQLAEKCRFEQEQSGVKIVLVPFAVDAELVYPQATQAPADDPQQQVNDSEPSGDDQ